MTNNEMPVTIWVTKVDSSHARIWGVEVHDSTQYYHHDTVVPKEQYDKVASYLYHVSKAAGDVDGIMISGGKTEVADKHDAEINHLKTKIGEYQTRIELQAEDIEALEAERDALREALEDINACSSDAAKLKSEPDDDIYKLYRRERIEKENLEAKADRLSADHDNLCKGMTELQTRYGEALTENEELLDGIRKIASCEKRADGDCVDIAQALLKKWGRDG